jgi:branched-chain amino acid transport system substrate-binding protein
MVSFGLEGVMIKMLDKQSRLTVAAGLAAIAFAASPALSQGTIKIGAPLALTGGLADEGKKQVVVWDMWLAKVNAAGGINVGGKKMKVEIVKYDYQTNGTRAGQLAEKLITDDKVNFLLAPFGSGHTKIVAAVAERYQVPLLACVSSSESVFNQGLKNLFGTLSPNGGVTTAVVKYFMKQLPSLKRVAVLGRDDVFPKSMAVGISESSKQLGLNVVYNQYYAVGTMDHSAALSAIKAARPDWIYATGYTQDLILIRKQMVDLGVKAPIVSMMTGPAYKEFADGLGDLANGITSSNWWHHAVKYKGVGVWPTTDDFYKEFVAKNKHDPDYVHASCAGGIVVLQDAIERAGTLDKGKVRDALAKTDVQTFYGPVKFSANGMNQQRDLPIIQVQDRKIKVLNPPEIKDADFQVMK